MVCVARLVPIVVAKSAPQRTDHHRSWSQSHAPAHHSALSHQPPPPYSPQQQASQGWHQSADWFWPFHNNRQARRGGQPPTVVAAGRASEGMGEEVYSQKDVENFWGELVERNFDLLRRKWSSLELLLGIPWLARERRRQRRLYLRENEEQEAADIAAEEREWAADRDRLEHATACLALAKSAYAAHAEEGISALDRFLADSPVRHEDVHYLNDTSAFVELAPVPGHLVLVAHEIKAICVVIRGTEFRDKHGKSWLPVDVMADLAAESSNFMGGQAHKGIAMIAEQMLSMHYERLCALHAQYRDEGYEIRIIGHSLGAGVGALLAMLLDRVPCFAGHVRCTAFSPPPVLSLELSRNAADIVDGYIVEDDIIPRLSINSINKLHRELQAYKWQSGAQDELRAELVFKMTGGGKKRIHLEEDFAIAQNKAAAVAKHRAKEKELAAEAEAAAAVRGPLRAVTTTVTNTLQKLIRAEVYRRPPASTAAALPPTPAEETFVNIDAPQAPVDRLAPSPLQDPADHSGMVWPLMTEAEMAVLSSSQSSMLVLPELYHVGQQDRSEESEGPIHVVPRAGGPVKVLQPPFNSPSAANAADDARSPSALPQGELHARPTEWDVSEDVRKGAAATAAAAAACLEAFSSFSDEERSDSLDLEMVDIDYGSWSEFWGRQTPQQRAEMLDQSKLVDKLMACAAEECNESSDDSCEVFLGTSSPEKQTRRSGDHYLKHNQHELPITSEHELYPPGRLFHLVTNGIKEESKGGRVVALASDCTHFTELPLAITSITNHDPTAYESCLRRAMKYAPKKIDRQELDARFHRAAEKTEEFGPENGIQSMPFLKRMKWALMTRMV